MSTVDRARDYGLTCWVRNLADGYDLTIESVAGGDVLP
jgi:acylphosphatase